MLRWEDECRCKVSEGVDIVLEGQSQALLLYIEVVVGVDEKKGPAKCGKKLDCVC